MMEKVNWYSVGSDYGTIYQYVTTAGVTQIQREGEGKGYGLENWYVTKINGKELEKRLPPHAFFAHAQREAEKLSFAQDPNQRTIDVSKLDVDNIKLWIADLRSGEVEQCRENLMEDDKRCCLGVACDTYFKATGCGFWTESSEFRIGMEESNTVLPATVAEWLGLYTVEGDIMDDPEINFTHHRSRTATGCNDSLELDFKAIADLLEALIVLKEQEKENCNEDRRNAP